MEATFRENFSIWQNKNKILTFTEIHRKFVEMGVVSSMKCKASTSRILKRLIKEGYIEKVGTKGYRLKIKPRPFNIIGKMKELQQIFGDSLIYE